VQRSEPVTTPTETRVRVLHMVSTFEEKTDTKWLLQLLSRIDRDRFETAAASFYGEAGLAARFQEFGIPTRCLEVPGEVNPQALPRAIRLIRAMKPHIVHTHLLRADLWGAMAARWVRVPVILSSAYAIGEYRRARRRRLDPLLDWVCRRLPTHVLAVSGAVKEDCVKRLGWAPEDVTVVYTGIDVPTVSNHERSHDRKRIRTELGLDEKDWLVVTVARLSYEKGLAWLIEAAKLLQDRHDRVRFLLVGDGPERAGLEEQVRQFALSDHVRFAGFRSDVDAVLSAADLFVLPSLMEGMPNALLEAWAASLPVVASEVGGLAEVVDSERTGLLVPPKNAPALADAIDRVLRDRGLARRLGEAGCQQVRDRFSVATVARNYENLYLRLIREWRERHDLDNGANHDTGCC